MCQKTGHTSEAGIDVGQRDHRGSAGERCRYKQRKLIHEITNRRTASRPAFIDLAWKELLRDAQFFAEKGDLVLLGFEILGFRIGEDEIKQDQAGANVFKRMLAAIAKVAFLDLAVESPRKKLIDGPYPK